MIAPAKPRDMTDYTAQYSALPFEAIQLKYRRALVLSEIQRLAPKRLLEIGCGELPLFMDLRDDIEITVLEPAAEFAANASKLSKGRNRVNVLQSYVEEFDPVNADFDMIVLSSVLHEVNDPAAMLASVYRLCGPSTMLHVVVPNARSLHRLLAVAMGLIPEPGVQSETQRTMQQRATIYDADSLRIELAQAGFEVADCGSLFVKPFTHAQMQRLVDEGFMTPTMLDGLDKLMNWLPEFGSEIWANARKAA
jgi:2-polyprenyl-3-methyl-5-hydroxy-6-metoxy-1,4-benzoquinol methylase